MPRNTWRRRVDELVAAGWSQDAAVLQAASEQPLGTDEPSGSGRVWMPKTPAARMTGAERNG